MTIGGKKCNLTRKSWMDFAAYCQIPAKAAIRLLNQQADALDLAVPLIRASFLPDDLKREYEEIVRGNTAILLQEG